MENLGVFIIILIFMILRGLYRQSQDRAQRERQGNVRPMPPQRPLMAPTAPQPKYEPIFPVGPSEVQSDQEEELWYEEEIVATKVPEATPASSPSVDRIQEWLQKRTGESLESLEEAPKPERITAKEAKIKFLTPEKPIMVNKYRKLLENPQTVRDAVVLSEIIRQPQF